jgi:hypothetical protein
MRITVQNPVVGIPLRSPLTGASWGVELPYRPYRNFPYLFSLYTPSPYKLTELLHLCKLFHSLFTFIHQVFVRWPIVITIHPFSERNETQHNDSRIESFRAPHTQGRELLGRTIGWTTSLQVYTEIYGLSGGGYGDSPLNSHMAQYRDSISWRDVKARSWISSTSSCTRTQGFLSTPVVYIRTVQPPSSYD